MLGIILTYFSCPEFLTYQLASFKKFVKTPYKVLVVDDSEEGLRFPYLDGSAYIRTRIKSNYYGASGRHQDAVNFGIQVTSRLMGCTDFLIFDNDMVFLSEFKLPEESWSVPQKNGTLIGSWMNLIFLKNQTHRFDFARCPETGAGSDSGGNFQGQQIIEQEDVGDGFQYLRINGASVVHFGAMSNWVGYPKEKYDERKERADKFLKRLVLEGVF